MAAAARTATAAAVAAPRGSDGEYASNAAGLAPAPRVAPKGLAGIFESHTPNAVLNTSNLPPNAVLLNVYDVSDSDLVQRINKATTVNDSVLIAGIFHGGVEVYEKEWSFGATEDYRTGVGAVWPRTHPQHTYRATIHMGNTKLNKDEVHAVLVRMAPEWAGNSYNLIHRNCCTFCNAFLKELGLRRIPGWVDRAARAASQVDKAVQLAKTLRSDEVKYQAAEALEALKRDSASVANMTHDQVHAVAMELGEKAQERVQELGTILWQWGKELRVEQEGDEQGVSAAALGEKVQEITGKAQEQMQALGSSMLQWGQDLQKNAIEQNAAANRRAVGKGQGAVGKGQGRNNKPSHGTDAADRGGFLMQSENRMLQHSLLAESDEDDDGANLPVAMLPVSRPRPGPVGQLPVVEAPIDWLSGPVAPAPTAAKPAFMQQQQEQPADLMDLLTGDLAEALAAPALDTSAACGFGTAPVAAKGQDKPAAAPHVRGDLASTDAAPVVAPAASPVFDLLA